MKKTIIIKCKSGDVKVKAEILKNLAVHKAVDFQNQPVETQDYKITVVALGMSITPIMFKRKKALEIAQELENMFDWSQIKTPQDAWKVPENVKQKLRELGLM